MEKVFKTSLNLFDTKITWEFYGWNHSFDKNWPGNLGKNVAISQLRKFHGLLIELPVYLSNSVISCFFLLKRFIRLYKGVKMRNSHYNTSICNQLDLKSIGWTLLCWFEIRKKADEKFNREWIITS